MMNYIRRQAARNLLNWYGTRISKRKFVSIESDDWGSIRMPSVKVHGELVEHKIIHPSDSFNRYDTLESASDVSNLCEVLSSVKDKAGKSAVITANFIMSNPDFDKIRKSNFETYHSQPFYETYDNYYQGESCLKAIEFAIDKQLFFPQFHGKEHLNVVRWMNFLKNGNDQYLKAFDRACFTVNPYTNTSRPYNLVAAYDCTSEEEQSYATRSFIEGIEMFKSKFRIASESFIAPNYTWNKKIEDVAHSMGVSLIQGSKYQNSPNEISGDLMRVRHSFGESNGNGQRYLLRNCLFEPTVNRNIDYVGECLKSISNAFFWGKPAIIGSHRLNFVGNLSLSNRDTNLSQLKVLLKEIVKRWPDVEFISSAFFAKFFNGEHEL